MIGNKRHLDNVILLKAKRAMHYRLEVKGYGIKVPELELGKSKIHIRWRPNTSGKLYDLLSREAAYNTIFIYQSIWPNLIRVLHICVHIPTHPKLWDKTIWWTKVGVRSIKWYWKSTPLGKGKAASSMLPATSCYHPWSTSLIYPPHHSKCHLTWRPSPDWVSLERNMTF